MIGVDAASFLVIVATAAVAGLIVTVVGPRVAIPVVVVELVLGILVGPQVAGIAKLDPATMFFGNLGLGMLFLGGAQLLTAGMRWEYGGRIFEEVKGRPVAMVAEVIGVSVRDSSRRGSVRSKRATPVR